MPDYTSQLVQEQFMAEEHFKNPNEPGKAPHIGALTMVASESKSTIDRDYSDPEKKKNIQLFWPEALCGEDVENAETECDITGEEPTSNSKTYNLARARQAKPFQLNRRKFETSMHRFNEMLAVNVAMSEKKLMEDLNKRIHAFLNTPANKTDITDAGYGSLSAQVDPSTKDILIHPAQFTAQGIFPIFWEVASRLGMNDPVLLSGGALSRLIYDVKKQQPTDQGKADALRLNDFRTYMDWTMDATLATEKVFMVDAGVLSILNRPDWRNSTPELVGDDRRVWSRDMFVGDTPQSKFAFGTGISGKGLSLKVDIDHQLGCGSRTEPLEKWRYVLNADVVRAPDTDCSAEAIGGNPYTGIVGFACGIPSES